MLSATAVGETVRLRVASSEVAAAIRPLHGISIRNRVAGTVRRVQPHGRATLVEFDVGVPVVAERSHGSVRDLAIEPGLALVSLVKSQAIRIVEPSWASARRIMVGRSPSMASKKTGTTKSATSKKTAAKKPAAATKSAKPDLAAQAHAIVHDALTEGTVSRKAVDRAVRETFDRLRGAIADAVPAERENVLRRVVDGMAEGVAESATKAGAAMKRATGAGKRLTSTDWSAFTSSMRTLEQDFFAAVSDAAGRLSSDTRTYLDSVTKAAQKAGTAIAPAAREAAGTAARHAPELAIETMKAGTRMAAGVAGEITKGLSGVMSGIADALRHASKPTEPATTKRSGPKKPSTKAPAKKATRRT